RWTGSRLLKPGCSYFRASSNVLLLLQPDTRFRSKSPTTLQLINHALAVTVSRAFRRHDTGPSNQAANSPKRDDKPPAPDVELQDWNDAWNDGPSSSADDPPAQEIETLAQWAPSPPSNNPTLRARLYTRARKASSHFLNHKTVWQRTSSKASKPHEPSRPLSLASFLILLRSTQHVL
ncbi:hypothetical protein BU23DRAFT_498558, partial [Bimuria novae-zelandiae CBS 107.79]